MALMKTLWIFLSLCPQMNFCSLGPNDDFDAIVFEINAWTRGESS